MILAIETSCDDTCAAVLDGPRILANTISSQAEAHARFTQVNDAIAAARADEVSPWTSVTMGKPSSRTFSRVAIAAPVASNRSRRKASSLEITV